jgi:hypothetical protein
MSGKGARLRRLEARRGQFRKGLSVKAFAREIRQHEIDSAEYGDGSFGLTLNRQTAARNDGTGRWHRVPS